MFYYVYIQDDKITAKGNLTKRIELPEGYKEVTKEIYESIGQLPCSFIEDNGEITSVEYIEPSTQPESQLLSEIEILGQQLVEKDLQILELQEENKRLGQLIVDLDLRLVQGGYVI